MRLFNIWQTTSSGLSLAQITNDSSKTMTFNLSNCSPDVDSIAKTGSGPSLLVAGSTEHLPTAGYSYKDGKGPFVAMPYCESPVAKWAGPITVKAGSTWKAGNPGDYVMVFDMPPGSSASTHKLVGLLLKSSDGDVAFADTKAKFNLTMPSPGGGCSC